MRLVSLGLSWFRGAADSAKLELGGSSVVVYGANGAGKSSFVDAVEYAIRDGRIGHLAHEYSGKNQEKAVPNTHTPDGAQAALSIELSDASTLALEIDKNGTAKRSGTADAEIRRWDYSRSVLRQDEIATFIRHTKGEKYSALLPLLGLQPLEYAAENLRQLAKEVEREAKLPESRAQLKQVQSERSSAFGSLDDAAIVKKVETLHARYCPEKAATSAASERCSEILTAIENRIASSTADQRLFASLQDVAAPDIPGALAEVRKTSATFAQSAEPLIAETLEVLESAEAFSKRTEAQTEISCPACGRPIKGLDFRAHVEKEHTRLKEAQGRFHARRAAIGTLVDRLKQLKVSLHRPDLASWRRRLERGHLAVSLRAIDALDAESLRTSVSEAELATIESLAMAIQAEARSGSQTAPLEAKQLTTDRRSVEAARAILDAQDTAQSVRDAEQLVTFLTRLEEGVRDEIRIRSKAVVDQISADVQKMWNILHPAAAIKDVRLHIPDGVDKAIDITLRFHNKEQDSPRLTLSEGYRNALGLCIFLAMAKQAATEDRPIFLDDVVVSLDRNHRGMIVELLEKELAERQVVILTHDRDWFAELRHQLDGKKWSFRSLLPYETPTVGIRWAERTGTFADARAQLAARPDSAGNDARKIMDVELALIAEKLQIRLPFLRAERNDRRMAHEFLGRLIGDGQKCFQWREGKDYQVYKDGLARLEKAQALLSSWGNKASHSFDIVRAEAEKLIEACEAALDTFQRCPYCQRRIWLAEAEGAEWVQCQCGSIRWRYGKG